MHLRLVLLASVLCSAGGADAQTRFAGDSPTRPALFRTNQAAGGPLVGAPFRAGLGVARSTYRSTRVVAVTRGGTLLGVGPLVAATPLVGGFPPGTIYWYGGVGFGCRRGCGPLCGCGPVILPPVVLDPGRLYGPRAVFDFYGWNRVGHRPGLAPATPQNVGLGKKPAPLNGRVNNNGPMNNGPAGMAAAERPGRIAARPVAAGPRARAWRFIDHGDRHFRAGRYREAFSRYKRAAASDSGLAAARFRIAFAHLGLGNIARASVAIRRGLDRKRDWPGSAFVLDDLYAGDADRDAAYRTLAEQLRETPNDADARFVAGVLLHFDGRPEAAAAQFRRVIAIAGDDPASRLFLPDEDTQEADPERG